MLFRQRTVISHISRPKRSGNTPERVRRSRLIHQKSLEIFYGVLPVHTKISSGAVRDATYALDGLFHHESRSPNRATLHRDSVINRSRVRPDSPVGLWLRAAQIKPARANNIDDP